MTTNRQLVIEKERVVHDTLAEPFLQQLARAHELTIREFARIFGVSKAHAEKILKHRTMPSLELAIRVARYFEVSVEELWGFQVDDDGSRKPLIAVIEGQRVRLKKRGSRPLVSDVAQQIKEEVGDV